MQAVDRIAYERMVEQRKKHHLESIDNARGAYWQPCLHNECPQCWGTGVKLDGGFCIHSMSCPCPKCSPRSLSLGVLHAGG